jgi:hypothetical protein
MQPAVSRPERSPLIEDYSVLLAEQLDQHGAAAALADHPIAQAALLGGRRPLSSSATRQISSLSYYLDDLALLSWNSALLIDPDPLSVATTADLSDYSDSDRGGFALVGH